MTGIGNNYQIASLSNCFVIGMDGKADSYGAIIRIDEEQVQLDETTRRCRSWPFTHPPQGFASKELGSYFYRIGSFHGKILQFYPGSCTGWSSRCSLMLSVSIKHPDSESFIDAKMTEGRVTGSQRFRENWWCIYEFCSNGTPYTQQYPVDSANPTTVKEIDAAILAEDYPQCMEICRTGCIILGYNYPWICAWLVRWSWIPDYFNQSLRWNSIVSLRQLSVAGT